MTATRGSLWRGLSPPQLLAGSFLFLVAVGTLGLATVPAFYSEGVPLGWVDALYMATSAVCVTGLVVVDTATHFTLAGQAFLLMLLQLGGLGMITITTLILQSLGRRLPLQAEAVTLDAASIVPQVEPRRLVRDVVLFTLSLEALGAAVLLVAFLPHFHWAEALWHAVFHAVSAFCNAGFSTFGDSLEGWSGHFPVLAVVTTLLVVGGIGFLTLEELAQAFRSRQRGVRFRISLHTRMVLVTTAAVVVGLGHFGQAVAHTLARGSSLQEMAVPESWVGRSLRELDLRKRYGIAVLAVHEMLTDDIIGVPDPEAPLKESDTLLVSGTDADLETVSRIPWGPGLMGNRIAGSSTSRACVLESSRGGQLFHDVARFQGLTPAPQRSASSSTQPGW